jgi:uncharacterized membrane protein YkvA (DUF1232 family)
MTLLGRIGDWAHRMRRDALAMWIAARARETPLGAKLLAAAVAAYAFSPIDLIPDFIPLLGMLDDIVIVPLGIALALRLMPDELIVRFRAEAEAWSQRPSSMIGAIAIVALWLAVIVWISWEALKYV